MHIDIWHCTNCSRSTAPMENLPEDSQGLPRVWVATLNKMRDFPYPVLESSKAKAEVLPLKMLKKHFYTVFSILMTLFQERMFYRQECNTAHRWATERGSTVLAPLCCFCKSLLIFTIYFNLPGLILVPSNRYKHSREGYLHSSKRQSTRFPVL